jgi:hypothetical protein
VGTVRREKNPEIPESYYIKSFVAGLQDYEQHHTQIQKPGSLIEAYWIARRLEASNPVKKHATATWSQRSAYRPIQKEVHKEIPVIVPPKPNTTAVPTRTANEPMAVKNDKCFRCGERWVPGHRFQCKMNKHVRAMLTKEEEDQEYLDELSAEAELEEQETLTAQVSAHAVQGITPSNSTSLLKIMIGKSPAVALVDLEALELLLTANLLSSMGVQLREPDL